MDVFCVNICFLGIMNNTPALIIKLVCVCVFVCDRLRWCMRKAKEAPPTSFWPMRQRRVCPTDAGKDRTEFKLFGLQIFLFLLFDSCGDETAHLQQLCPKVLKSVLKCCQRLRPQYGSKVWISPTVWFFEVIGNWLTAGWLLGQRLPVWFQLLSNCWRLLAHWAN